LQKVIVLASSIGVVVLAWNIVQVPKTKKIGSVEDKEIKQDADEARICEVARKFRADFKKRLKNIIAEKQ